MHRHVMSESRKLIEEGLRALSIRPGRGLLDSFDTYLRELKKWNRAHNLTGLKTDRDIIIKHFFDSVLFLDAVPPETSSIADVGSGAGFPGIPMKIVRPEITVFLIEPTLKKAVFLRHMIHVLQLSGIEVIDRRIEEVDGVRVDAAVTRALFSVRDFIEKAGHIVVDKGVFILSKGPRIDEEIKIPGQFIAEKRTVALPILNIRRHLVVARPGKS